MGTVISSVGVGPRMGFSDTDCPPAENSSLDAQHPQRVVLENQRHGAGVHVERLEVAPPERDPDDVADQRRQPVGDHAGAKTLTNLFSESLMSPLRAAATTMPIGPNNAGPPRCTSRVTVDPSPFGAILASSLILTPPLPSPLRVMASGGLKCTIVHLTRLGMPFTSTIDSMIVPFSRVSGSLLRHTRWMVSHSL